MTEPAGGETVRASVIGRTPRTHEVQKRLLDEFKLSLTYRDTRFLIDDLGLDIQAPPPPKAPSPASTPPAGPRGTPAGAATPADAELMDDDAGYDDLGDDPEGAAASLDPDGAAASGSVKVEVDRVMRPGTVVSGSVTFSDGKAGKWALDQYGRLMFESNPPGHRPGPADLQAFQRELSAVLQRQGY